MRRIVLGSLAVLALSVWSSPSVAVADDKPEPVEEWQIRGITRALEKDEYPKVRAYAAKELTRLIEGSTPLWASRPNWKPGLYEIAQRASGNLRDLLTSTDPEVRGAAAQALGCVGAEEDARYLRQLLKEEDVRLGAVQALGWLGNKDDDVPALRKILDEGSDESVKQAAENAIVRIIAKNGLPALWQLFKDPLSTPDAAAEALRRTVRKSDVPELRLLLQDKELPYVRALAAELLGLVRDTGAAPDLRRLLEVKPQAADISLAAAVALRRVGNKGDRPALRNLLEDKNPFLRVAAAKALERSGGSDDALALRKYLDLEDTPLEGLQAAAAALGRVGDREDAQALQRLLKKNDQWGPPPRLVVADALRRLGDPDAPAFRQFREDPDMSVRLEAAKALGAWGSRATCRTSTDSSRSQKRGLRVACG
jgi:HEAT repeat protein